ELVAARLGRGESEATQWEGVLSCACEMLLRRPGIVALHATTGIEALHAIARATTDRATRVVALLQAAAWCARWRGALGGDGAVAHGLGLDELEPASGKRPAPRDVLDAIASDRPAATRLALAAAADEAGGRALLDAAIAPVVEQGTDSHDYKYLVAV